MGSDIFSKHFQNALKRSLKEWKDRRLKRYQGQALVAPRRHHSMAWGMPMTLGQHTSMHTWTP